MSNNRLLRPPWFTRRPLLSRSHQIITTLARHGLGWLAMQIESSGPSNATFRKDLRRTAQDQAGELVKALVELGPTFIKFGQALSARGDLLPLEYIQALSTLQDTVPPLPFEAIQTVLTVELGKDPLEIYAWMDHTPIASASIGQVYAARLWNGDEVVVKVVRPGAEETFEKDLEILSDMAEWAANHTALGHIYNLPVLIDEFAHTVRAEFDYIQEGRNAEAFYENFSEDSTVYIPKVYWEYTTHRVITLERVAGVKINDLPALDKGGINRQTVAENLMHFALRQIFEFGLYHDDPHPGNFFVQPDGSLAVVDFGMVGRLTQTTKRTFLGISLAIERGEADILVDELLNAGIYTHGVDRKALSREIERLFDRFTGASLKDLTANRVTSEIMNIVLRHGLQLPGELVAMTRAVTISEGTGTALYPGFDLIQFASPYVRRFWKTERNPLNMAPRVGQALFDGMEFSMDLPRRLQRLLGQVERGQLEVNINNELIRETMAQLQKMTNRMALAMILSAVIIALSLVMVISKPASWQNLGEMLFGFALISSIVFGLWLVVSIIRSGRT